MSKLNAFLMMNITSTILLSLAGGIIIGFLVFYLIIKLKNRNKNKKVKINSKASDYQFQFKLNTGQFINNLKNADEDRGE